MIHLIILLHFICFTLGASFLALLIMIYKNKKEDMTKDILIGETLFSMLFFIDSIGIYVRRILNEYNIEKIFSIINIVLMLASIFYLYKITYVIIKDKIYKQFNIIIKTIIDLSILTAITFLLSFKFKSIERIPYLCIIYLLQCTLGMFYIKYKSSNTNIDVEEKSINDENQLLEYLTDRERGVIEYVCMGLSNKEIGEKLFISPNTVKNHVYNIYKKVNVKNKVELINLMKSHK